LLGNQRAPSERPFPCRRRVSTMSARGIVSAHSASVAGVKGVRR